MSVQSQINRLETAKAGLRAVIEYKGVQVPEGTKLDALPGFVMDIQQNIGIDTSDANATANDMPIGVSAYAKGEKVEGTVPVLSEPTDVLNAIPVWDEERQTIKGNFYATNSRILLEPNVSVYLHFRGDKLGDAEDADVTEGKTYTSANGLKRTGTKQDPIAVAQATPTISVSSSGLIKASATQGAGLVSAGTKSATKQLDTQAAQTITPGTSNKTISYGRYLTGTQTIKGDENLIPENIKAGISIFGVAGTLVGGGLPDGVTALESGTVTIAQTSTYENITHNLGVKPNFIAWMMEDAATATGLTSAAVCGASFDTGSDSSNIRYMVDGYNSSGSGGGTAARATNSTYMTITTARMSAHSSYKLVAGKTYRWICGVMKVV